LIIPPHGRIHDLHGELASKNVRVAFARVSEYLRADLDRFGLSAILGEARIFARLHDAIAASSADRSSND
jgi:hypothetical protein